MAGSPKKRARRLAKEAGDKPDAGPTPGQTPPTHGGTPPEGADTKGAGPTPKRKSVSKKETPPVAGAGDGVSQNQTPEGQGEGGAVGSDTPGSPAPARPREPLAGIVFPDLFQTMRPVERLALFRDEVLADVADGVSVGALCERMEVTRLSFAKWVSSDAELNAQYRESLRLAATAWAERADYVLRTADSRTISVAREQASLYKWYAKVLDREAYGDTVDVTSGNKPVGPRPLSEVDAELAALQAKYTKEAKV